MLKQKHDLKWIWLLAGILALVSTPLLAADGDPLQQVRADFEAQRISVDDWALLTVQIIKNPQALPSAYSLEALSAGEINPHAASPAIKQVIQYWDSLQPATQSQIALALARVSTEFEYVSPSGFFRLHYDTDPDSANPVPEADDDFSGFPDFVEKVAAYLDTTLAVHIDLGYQLPPSDGSQGGDDKYDIYFETSTLFYGYCQPEGHGPQPWNDYTSYVVFNTDYSGFAPNQDPEGSSWGAVKATAAHEFHHAVQYGYDFSEADWFQELDAVFFEEMAFDATNDCYNYLDKFFDYPEKSLMETGPHAYGCFIYGLYLAQHFDTSLMRGVWEGSLYGPTVFEALSDTLLERFGWSHDSVLAEFVTWNYCTDIRDDGQHYEEAAGYPLVHVGRSHAIFPVQTTNSPANPAGYGAAYVEFIPGENLKTLEVTFNGSDSRSWAAYLVKSSAENVHEFQKLELEASSQATTVQILNFESYDRVTLIGVNVDEFSSSAAFSYSARLIAPYAVELELVTADSAVYSGGERTFECRITNPSALNDVYNFVYWDNQGWVPLDSTIVPVLAFQDTVVAVLVRPPQGTAVDSTSVLSFRADSYGNSSVTASVTGTAKVMLYRGDMNFTGGIDIADLVYMVNYFFNGGPEPLPTVEAADHTCDSAIDIADMVHLVQYMFSQGEPCPCNPY
ncbi:MAG: MXAN_6640 family putative metalloprotease [bacterium]